MLKSSAGSSLQFAGTILFHYLFPPLSIGLGLQLFLCELAYFRTRKPEWEDVQGEMMPRAEVTGFWDMAYNPSSVDRLTHTLIGAFVLGAFFVASVCSFYLLKNRHQDVAKRCLSIALPPALLLTILAAVTGHDSAQKLVETQPAKLAAMEAHFHTSDEPTGLTLFGWPDAENETVHFGVKLPYLLSLMVYNDPTKPVPGMDQIPEDERPPVWLPFQTFHLMVGLGTMMIGVAGLACFSWYCDTYYQKRWLMWAVVLMPLAFYEGRPWKG